MSIEKGSHDGETLVRPPTHPVPQLQKPFEESMVESVDDQTDQDVPMDAMTRRTILLEAPIYERVIAGRWRQKRGEKYHPLWKLVAQMSFGMHLLAEGMAISEEEVMRILQSHVDDIDGFLERTTEDFELAQSDIHERIRCLKLPLAHGEVFDRMLEDRAFRASILDGNEKIDHVVSRTKRAAKDALKDVQKGFDATNVLEKYLSKLNSTWRRASPEHEAVLVAMLGNAEGWRRAFLELHLQGNKLAGSLKKLAEVVAEMQRRAAAVSRKLAARTQKQRHISSQKSNHVPSQMGSIVHQKPLPTEPGREHKSKHSSHSTPLTGLSSRPDSGHKSSQGFTSHSSAGHPTRPSTASKTFATSEPKQQSLSSLAKALEESRLQQDRGAAHGPAGVLNQKADLNPIELPADVPEGLLRQAPVSIKNRLSMTLGLKPKDYSDHRISSLYYPRALGDLLKSPQMSDLLTTTPSRTAKGTPVHAVSSPAANSHAETDYFSSHEMSTSIGVVTPDNSKKETTSNKTSPRATRSSTRSSVVGSASGTRRSSIPNLAFTSHTSVMAMASPPAELPTELLEDDRASTSRPRIRSRSQPSSLGEPGPVLTGGATNRSRSVSDPMLLVDTSIITVSVVPASAEEESFAAAEQKAGEANQANQEQLLQEPKMEAVGSTPKLGESNIENKTDMSTRADSEERLEDRLDKPTNGHKDTSSTRMHFVAELEAIVPGPLNPSPHKKFGPAELEAPQQTFRLPPRPIKVIKDSGKEASRASIHQLDEFFKLPTGMTVKPGMKPKDFSISFAHEPIRPLRLKLTNKDGKFVPVQVDSGDLKRGDSPASNPRLDAVAGIINTMSDTPPGSPIHARSNSWASASSAQRWSYGSSRPLGPPGQARPPPAPGGRPMVNPDFATAGAFEGERKQKKQGAIGSKSGWKTFFSGGGTGAFERPELLITIMTRSAETFSRPRPSSQAVPRSPDMLTTSGKDVLWFKGTMKRKKRRGVSSA
ncbi:hypothetical protein H2202_005511 [Exophiala xenobiotica]|nr:hypothetical protein H2202_005511 [Exophiala xenobiotica]